MKLIFHSIILVVFFAACNQQSTDKKNSKIQEEVIEVNSKTDSLSLLNNLNAFNISSLESRSLILAVIISKNSEKSMVPEPSLSISEIIFFISSFLGSKPRARIATLSSFASIVPLPSVSKRSKASCISYFYSSVSSERFFGRASEVFL
jgi:hypothetical protein